MTHNARWSFGALWPDNALPAAIGAASALVIIYLGGPFWSLLVVPLLCWCVWQLTCWSGGRPGLRIGLVTSIALVLIVYVFLLFGVDTAKLRQAVEDAGIPVIMVSSDRSALVVNIQPVSYGPKRNVALRAIFTAAHTHAKSKKAFRFVGATRWPARLRWTTSRRSSRGRLRTARYSTAWNSMAHRTFCRTKLATAKQSRGFLGVRLLENDLCNIFLTLTKNVGILGADG